MSIKNLVLALLFIALFIPNSTSAQQNQEQCATVYADSVLRVKYNLPSKKEFENWLAPKIVNTQNQRSISGRFSGPDVYTLPVVVHVIHNGDAVGSNENISAAQVYSQIDVLNQDFRRLNPDTGNAPASFQAVASDVGIEFCLAQVDPNGNILTEPGIDRVNAGQSTWSNTNDIDNTLKPSTIWDPERYFNIWVVDFGNTGLLGYAQFPSNSGLQGLTGGAANTDGIVCYHLAFGTVGNVNVSTDRGRTATHEAGHWLGLRHIWGDGGCGVDDFCNDTPESDASNRGCPSTTSCNTLDMVQNYMDYTNDECMNMFTEDQVARMRTVMLNSPRRVNLANSTVCQVLDEYTLTGQVRDAATLIGIPNARVLVSNSSYNYNITTDALGNFTVDVFEGTYDVYAGKWSYVTNVNASVVITANTGPIYVDLDKGYYDDFIFDFNWTESGNATTGSWERGVPQGTFYNNAPSNPGADVTNDYGNEAYVTGNGGGNAGTDDVDDGNTIVTSPVFDLSTYTEPFISYYRWFYNDGGNGSPDDSLIVRLSNGNTTVVVDLLTQTNNQWSFNQLQVRNYLTPTANMQISFETMDQDATGHLVEGGLDLFRVIDSVTNQNAPPVANFNGVPASICTGESVSFTDLSTNLPSSWTWTFQGGTPANSSQQNPSVVYNSPGMYEVSLTATNAFGSDSETKTGYITVSGVDAAFTADVQSGCAGIVVTFTDQSTCGPTSWNWTFPGGTPATSNDQNPVVTYNSIGDYDVSLSVNNAGSSDTQTETNFISIGTGPVNVFFEDFESDNFNTNAWTIDNPDNATTWEIYTVGGTLGGDKAAGVNFYNYNNAIGAEDGMITPVLNLSNVTNTVLSFDHAFRRYSQNEQDSLKILVSTDGGATYPNLVFARAEDGTGSFATNTTTTTEFFPNANDDWCFSGGVGASCITIDLSAFDQTNNVRIKFLTVNDYGNNLYLDNIDVSGQCTVPSVGPIADFTSNTTETCEGTTVSFTDLSQNNPDTWIWTFAGGTPSSSNGANPTVTYNNPGVYSVELTVSNPDGSDSKVVNSYITINENPTAVLTGNSPSCYSSTDGVVSANVSGGTSPYSYDWSNGATGISINSLAVGTYTVTVTDDNSCESVESFNLVAPDSLQINFSKTDAYCGNSNGSVQANVSGGSTPYSYAWSNNASSSSINNLNAGNYILTVTDANNCSKTVSINVLNIQTNLQLGLLVNPLTCNNGMDASLTLTVSGGAAPYHYNWNTGDTTATISNLGAGAYAVTVRDTNFCSSDTSITISNPAGLQVVEQLTDASCGNSDGSISLSVSGGASPYTYTWSNGATLNSISGLSSGNYTVTITDDNSCFEVNTYSINNIGGPSVQLTTSSISCQGGTDGGIFANVNGGTTPYTYIWNITGSADSIVNLGAGTYSLTVADANGCNTYQSIVLSEPLPITANANITPSACTFNSGQIDLSISGGTSGYTVNWSNGSNGTSISGLGAGTYTATITDANGCVYTDSYIVGNSTAPSAQLTVVNVACNGASSGAASLNPMGAGPFQYTWSNGNTSPINSNLSAGTYSYTLTDANGCVSINSFNVTEPSALQVSANISDASCAASDGQISVSVSGGTASYTYLWSTGQVSNTISNLSAGNYTLTVTDANGCSKIRNYSVSNLGGPVISLVTSHISCAGLVDGAVDMTVSGGTTPYTYNWSNGSSSQDIINLPHGAYSVTVSDAGNCVSVASAIVRSPDSLEVNYQISTVQCGQKLGTVIPFVNGGAAPYDFVWSNGSVDSILWALSGGYNLVLIDANGCQYTDSVFIPSNNIHVDLEIAADSGQSNGSILVNLSGGTPPYSYSWSDSNITATDYVDGLSAGTYSVILRDSLACDTLINIEVPLFSSVEQYGAKFEIELFPNPNEGSFILKMKDTGYPLQFELFNTLGKKIDNGQLISGTVQHQFNYQNVASGVYFLRLYNDKVERVEKIVIRKN